MLSKKIKGISSLIGSILIHLIIGNIFSFSNFIPYLDSISIKIQKNFSNEIYFNNFHLGYFKKSKYFPFNLTIKNLIDIFKTLIQKENLKIFQIQANLKLIFFLSFKEQIELNLLNLNQVNNNIEQNKQNQKLKFPT